MCCVCVCVCVYFDTFQILYFFKNNKQGLPIQVLIGILYKHCTAMAFAFILRENVKLNFCHNS